MPRIRRNFAFFAGLYCSCHGGITIFQKLWPLWYKRAESDLRWKNSSVNHKSNLVRLYEGKTPLNKLWLVLDKRVKLDLR